MHFNPVDPLIESIVTGQIDKSQLLNHRDRAHSGMPVSLLAGPAHCCSLCSLPVFKAVIPAIRIKRGWYF